MMRRIPKEEKEERIRLYKEGWSTVEIAEKQGLTNGTIGRMLKKWGILVRSHKEAKLASKNRGRGIEQVHGCRKGSANSNWKGGIIASSGYILVRAPWHPKAQKQTGYVAQQILVAEWALGRFLLPGEIVHHLNRSPSDNNPNNLVVMDRPSHSRFHATLMHRNRKK